MQPFLHSLKDKINPAHTALLVIDMQNDFCHPNGSMAQMGQDIFAMSAVAPTIAALVEKGKEWSILTVYLRVIDTYKPAISPAYYEANYSYYEPLLGKGDQVATEAPWMGPGFGEDFYQPIAPDKDDIVVTKHRFGAFVNTQLDQILRSNGIKTVIITGVLTEVCVETTAREALDYDYYVVIPEDCTATTSQQRKDASLDTLGRHFGTITTSSQIIDILKNDYPL
jgi:ureidoacrylate peracid hydrolase